MEIEIKEINSVITVALKGRMDTPASQEVVPEMTALQDKADKTIVLDCSELTYISSSGLRIFLSLRKAAAVKGGEVIIRNINDDIRSVFMMTGFLNLFEIENA
ncbi:MAG: STAS domain-containing protein [Bacteroidales bacterium]|nr:STAS domain-containing protein [Bacteroidales bacterium]MBP5537876.1 STAS domain-containing protein [Bacteroidales bacterium]